MKSGRDRQSVGRAAASQMSHERSLHEVQIVLHAYMTVQDWQPPMTHAEMFQGWLITD